MANTFPYTRIGIIGAMQVEIDLLIQTMERQGAVSMSSITGRDFYEGDLNGTPVVVVQCGVGMVNAALCAQVLITSFSADAVINTGIAGSLDPSIDIGDVVLSTDSVNHIMDVQNLGYEPGQTPGVEVVAYPASETLRNTAKTAALRLDLSAHEGRVASGDRFVREESEKERIKAVFQASCCEMEGAAIAQTCYLSKIPYLIVRAISDKADGSASVDYPTFEAKAAHDCAALTIEMVGCLE